MMMTGRKEILCEAGMLKSVLKHAWIENTILRKTEEDIAFLLRNVEWNAIEEFPERLKELRHLSEIFELGFSPCQIVMGNTYIVKSKYFQNISNENRTLLMNTIHQIYVETSGVLEVKNELNSAINHLEKEFMIFENVWKKCKEGKTDIKALIETWCQFKVAAENTHNVLCEMPSGVVLP